jgi:hypothetical protein
MPRSFDRTGTRHEYEARRIDARRVDAWPYDLERERLARISRRVWEQAVAVHVLGERIYKLRMSPARM